MLSSGTGEQGSAQSASHILETAGHTLQAACHILQAAGHTLQAAAHILQAARHIYMYLPLSAAEAHRRDLRSSVLQADHAQSPAAQPRDAPFEIRFPLRTVHDSCFFFGGS
jgi:hypothetical protein